MARLAILVAAAWSLGWTSATLPVVIEPPPSVLAVELSLRVGGAAPLTLQLERHDRGWRPAAGALKHGAPEPLKVPLLGIGARLCASNSTLVERATGLDSRLNLEERVLAALATIRRATPEGSPPLEVAVRALECLSHRGIGATLHVGFIDLLGAHAILEIAGDRRFVVDPTQPAILLVGGELVSIDQLAASLAESPVKGLALRHWRRHEIGGLGDSYAVFPHFYFRHPLPARQVGDSLIVDTSGDFIPFQSGDLRLGVSSDKNRIVIFFAEMPRNVSVEIDASGLEIKPYDPASALAEAVAGRVRHVEDISRLGVIGGVQRSGQSVEISRGGFRLFLPVNVGARFIAVGTGRILAGKPDFIVRGSGPPFPLEMALPLNSRWNGFVSHPFVVRNAGMSFEIQSSTPWQGVIERVGLLELPAIACSGTAIVVCEPLAITVNPE